MQNEYKHLECTNDKPPCHYHAVLRNKTVQRRINHRTDQEEKSQRKVSKMRKNQNTQRKHDMIFLLVKEKRFASFVYLAQSRADGSGYKQIRGGVGWYSR